MNERNYNIDVVKGVAIISVILLHSISTEGLLFIGAPYHIWQAVPIFMMITGLNAANSFKRKGYNSLIELYNPFHIKKKLIRVLVPFVIVWLGQLTIHFIMFDGLSFLETILSFLTGGWGPGSYYIPLTIQAILVTPLIYIVVKKYPNVMMLIIFLISTLLEGAVLLTDMSNDLYRLLIVRYIFALALGVWLSFNKGKINCKWLITLAVGSLVYITGVNYFDWVFLTEGLGWRSQHAPSFFYVLLLIVVALKLYKFEANNPASKLIIKIGQASYHIFLTQMVYFWSLGNLINEMNQVLYIIVSIVLCVVFGLLFYDIERAVRNMVVEKNEVKVILKK